MTTSWTLLAPDTGDTRRRSRGLGVISAVRHFNELAVPGLGGLWFARPLVWSLLGIQLTERVGGRNISNANAVEALACWLGLRERGGEGEPRMQGIRKLGSIGSRRFVSFQRATQGGFYVTTPMRMGTGQPLEELGLVEARIRRFNAYRLAPAGVRLLEQTFEGCSWHSCHPLQVLVEWAERGRDLAPRSLDTPAGRRALSPLYPLPQKARTALEGRLYGVGSGIERRIAVRDWLRSGKVNGDWTEDPPDSIAPDHWRDLEVGAAFILARDAALAVLDAVEARVRADPARKLELDALRGQVPGKEVEQEVASFREAAAAFMAHGYDPSPDALATDLCVLSERPSAALVSDLVERDGTGLVLRGSNIRPGPAFPPDGATIDALRDGSDPEPPSIVLPPGVSPRVRNLWTLDLDLRGELSEFLAGDEE